MCTLAMKRSKTRQHMLETLDILPTYEMVEDA